MIKLQIVGNLGKDCIVKEINGKNVINFSVAHTEKFKDAQGNPKERTTWVECAYWTDRTAIAPYLQKGQQVYVEGRPDVKAYMKNDGTAGASLSLQIREVQLLCRKGDNNLGGQQSDSGSSNRQQPAGAPAGMDDVADDLPF